MSGDLVDEVHHLRKLLTDALQLRISHKELADWCYEYWSHYWNDDAKDSNIKIFEVAEDIDAQWELYLVNSFPLNELQTLDQSTVKMPTDWWEDWLRRLD